MSAFWNNLFGFSRREAADPGGVPSPSDGSTKASNGGDWTEQLASVSGRRSLLVPAWYRGVSLRMQTMGQMLMQYQRRSKTGGNFVEDDYSQNGQLNYLLQVRPNPLLTASQLLEQIEFRKIFYGNAYVYVERDLGGTPRNLWLCSGGSYLWGQDAYQLTYQTPLGVLTTTVPSGDVLHFKNVFLNESMTEGLPLIRYAKQSLQIAGTADQQSLHDMAKGGRYKLLVREETPQSMSYGASAAGRANQDELRKMTKELGEDWMSQDAIFASNIADVKIISQTAADLKLLETRGYQVTELARLLGVPKPMMMDDRNSSYKTPEAATQEFLLRTISPLIREMEDELNSKLLGPDDFGKRRIHVCEKALRRLDPTAQANLFRTYLETGAYTVNEIRSEMDMGSVKDGDKNYISTNLAELGSKKLSGDGGAAAQQQPTEQDGREQRPEGRCTERSDGRTGDGEKREGGER